MNLGEGSPTSGAIAINTRFKSQKITGAQRYAWEVSRRFTIPYREIAPTRPLRGIQGQLWEQIRLPALCASDVLWSPISAGPILYRRQVVSILDMSPVEHPEWFSKGFGQWYGYMLPRLARRVRHVLAISEYTRQRIIALARVPSSKVTAIPLGADAAFMKRSEEECRDAKGRFGISTPHYLLSLCSLEPRKNLSRLLSVWKELQAEIPSDWCLVLAGGKGASAVFAAEPLLADVPRVVFTGYVEDALLPALISGASAFIYPSLYEGFGLPVLEAMRCGVSVIASNATSLPEVTGSDAALLVSPTDSIAIGRAIREVVGNRELRARLADAGLRRSQQFSWDRCAAETEALLIRETSAGYLPHCREL